MSTFCLPDLGEGLPDAEIVKWYVEQGEKVKIDSPLVAVETAKAVVDVPAPYEGTIKTLHGNPGDVIKTGAPLVEFEESSTPANQDTGTVVGAITVGTTVLPPMQKKAKATPAIKQLAKEMGIDLATIKGTGPNGTITRNDLNNVTVDLNDYEQLKGVRRTMSQVMTKSHNEVVPASVFDDAYIDQWSAEEDISARIILAIAAACKSEPAMNAWYHSASLARKIHQEINLGIGIDTSEGLFVPVIKDIGNKNEKNIREELNNLKQQANDRTLTPEQFHDATITLSNFGTFAGRYATPVVVPPTVAIIGTGKIRNKVLPVSLSFDHRACTGGEASRFLKYMLEELSK